MRAAADNRDALAKTLYSRLFDWLVARVNTSIGQDAGAASVIGVLDIYGEPVCGDGGSVVVVVMVVGGRVPACPVWPPAEALVWCAAPCQL